MVRSTRKGIILAGGHGTRLYPATLAISKQLLPVYDKPMVYYPLSTLMLTGIRDILLISTAHDIENFQKLLGDGTQWGIQLSYCIQEYPEGIAQALVLAEDFLQNAPCALILGDNIFYGHDLVQSLHEANKRISGATIFAYPVKDPERYGVVKFDEEGKVIDIEEKPAQPKSRYAITGLYFYDQNAVNFAKTLTPSARGELEITDLNRCYLNQQCLHVAMMGRGLAWLDTGTPDALLEAAQYIQVIEHRQGLKICCPEEIAWRCGWITDEQLKALAKPLSSNSYGEYLMSLVNTTIF